MKVTTQTKGAGYTTVSAPGIMITVSGGSTLKLHDLIVNVLKAVLETENG